MSVVPFRTCLRSVWLNTARGDVISLSDKRSIMHLALTRRAVATALLSLPALTIHPQRAAAGLFGDDGPQGSFRDLTLARIRLNELVGKLESTELKGDEPDDAIVVLQTLTVQFGGTVKLLAKTTEAMTLLPARR